MINFLKTAVTVLLSCTVFACYVSAKYYPDNIDNIYVHRNTDEKTIALTFDDGPHPHKTEKILEVLKKYGIKATFFVIGENASLSPDVLKKVSDEGHEIGNHTYDHKSIYKIKSEFLLESIKRCEQTIYDITGKRPSLFRPPEGYLNDNIAESMYRAGYDVILWRVDTYDWKGRSAEDIFKTVVSTVKCGDIILMHDYISIPSNTAKALDMIIPALLDKGYKFVTVSELISQ